LIENLFYLNLSEIESQIELMKGLEIV
jgi:hypothetical protein